MQEWLSPHPEDLYLRTVNPPRPPPNNQEHVALQAHYAALLNLLYQGYSVGMPQGASLLNAARSSMLAADGIEGALDAVANQGLIAVFDPVPDDPRFAPVVRQPLDP